MQTLPEHKSSPASQGLRAEAKKRQRSAGQKPQQQNSAPQIPTCVQKVLKNAHQRQKTLEAEACQPKLTELFYEREIQKRDHVVAMLYQQIGKIKSKIDQLKVEQAHVRHHSAQIGGQRGPQGKPGRKDAMVVEEARAVEIGRARASETRVQEIQ